MGRMVGEINEREGGGEDKHFSKAKHLVF